MILPKVAQIIGEDVSRLGSGSVPFSQFRSTLQSLAQGALTEHEIVTLARYYQDPLEDPISLQTLVAVAQEELRKVGFEDFRDLHTLCIQLDKQR